MNTKDNTYKVIERIKNSNNGYTYTYSKHAAEGAANTGQYTIRKMKDFQGDIYYTVKPLCRYYYTGGGRHYYTVKPLCRHKQRHQALMALEARENQDNF